MMTPTRPADDARRLGTLRGYELLDTPPEQAFDDLTALAAQICAAPIALISLIDENRQWVKSQVGWSVRETPRDISFCSHAIQHSDLFIVPDASQDKGFADNPLVTGDPHLRFYAGAPLIAGDGAALGTLCLMDRVPRELSPAQQAALRILGRQVMAQVELRRQARARPEREFSEALINSLPGVLYLYNQQGRFLRWNRNLERVTGYSTAEISTMHPLDFFAGADREAITARIKDVFVNGESSAEADFVTKDGRVIPYYFTGMATRFDGELCLVGVGMDITARREAQASEARYRTLFDHAPDGIVIADSQSNYVDANASMCRMLGYPLRELIGLHASNIVEAEEVAHIEPALSAIKEGGSYQREWRFRRKDKSVFSAEVIATTMPDGNLLGMIRDITSRKQAELRLGESEQKYRELVELANSIILRWNSAGKITFLNEYGLRFFGYAVDEIMGRNVVGTIVPETDSAGRDMHGLIGEISAAPDAFDRTVNENMRRGGERVWISWTNRIIRDPRGEVFEILSVGTDITKQRLAEAALRELNETLEHRVAERTAELQTAAMRAESADRVKSAFLATMSHELRTPLNSIIGFTGIVLQGLAGPLNDEQSKQLGMVRTSARHLLELINDVLDISKIEAEQLEVCNFPFDLKASLARVAALVRPLAERKHLDLVTNLAPDLGIMNGDRRRIEQIVLNLLNNAIKFTDRGQVTLAAEAISDYRPSPLAPAVAALRLRVTDSGIGIRPEDLASLFQPFRQIDTGLARQHEGTGLGLAICRRLATLMGGEISVASVWAQGSEFTVVLPLLPTPAP